jgi:hypothetical protein
MNIGGLGAWDLDHGMGAWDGVARASPSKTRALKRTAGSAHARTGRLSLTLSGTVQGLSNFLWLRSAIARERGIAAYRAWLPLERIRPRQIPQDKWEETFAWPADNQPPYPPLRRRIARAVVTYALVLGGAAILVQLFTTFPVLTWIGRLLALVSRPA